MHISLLRKSLAAFLVTAVVSVGLSSCVDQHPDTAPSSASDAALVATSAASADICARLNLPLVGVCETSHTLALEYQDLPRVGLPMNPDMEIISSLHPDYVLSPSSLQNDLEPKYKKAGLQYIFLQLRSVEGMYDSIDELGKKFDRTQEAAALRAEFESFMSSYADKHKDKVHPRVLVLMGLPGSYLVATPQSYVGSLVALAGGENVFKDSEEEFLSINTEELKKTEPDIILRAAHGIPDDVVAMFAEEFATNQIWKHFTAVQEGRVYDLDPATFGMSANFSYTEALDQLEPLLYTD